MANLTITLGPATIVVDADDVKKAYDKVRTLVKKARGKTDDLPKAPDSK